MKREIHRIIGITALFSLAASGWAEDVNGVDIEFTGVSAGGGVTYDYRIGVTEVSVGQFNASGIIDTGEPHDVYAPPDSMPAVNLTWHEAARFCNFLTTSNQFIGAYQIGAGGIVTNIMSRTDMLLSGLTYYVLPTEDEWFNAAYITGGGTQLYSTVSGNLPVHEAEAIYMRAQATGPWTVTSGTNEINGTLNMMGNVWEWTESTEGGEAYNYLNNSQNMAFYGGDWFLGADFLASTNKVGDVRNEAFNIGMRVVAIPEPGTMSLMGLSTLGLFTARSFKRRRMFGNSLIPVQREPLCDTFLSQEEWEVAQYEAAVDAGEHLGVGQVVKEEAAQLWAVLRTVYQQADVRFWNYMVVSYERRKLRRKAFRKTFKKKMLNGLDSFLALIMK